MQFRVNARQLDSLKLAMEYAKEEPEATEWTREYAGLNPEFRKDISAAIQASLQVASRRENLLRGVHSVGGDILRVKMPQEVKVWLDGNSDDSEDTRSLYRSKLLAVGIPNIQHEPYVHWANRSVESSTLVRLSVAEWGNVNVYKSRSVAMRKAMEWFTDTYTKKRFNERVLKSEMLEEMETNAEKLLQYVESSRGKPSAIAKRVYWPKPLIGGEDFLPVEVPRGWTLSGLIHFVFILWVQKGCP